MRITQSKICTWETVRRLIGIPVIGALQCALSMCILCNHSIHPDLQVPDTPELCSSEQLRGGKLVPTSLPNCKVERTAGQLLYRSILEKIFPVEGCMVRVPPIMLRTCIKFWRSVIISEECFLSLRWRDFSCGNSPFCAFQENLGRLARLYSFWRVFFRNLFPAVFQI